MSGLSIDTNRADSLDEQKEQYKKVKDMFTPGIEVEEIISAAENNLKQIGLHPYYVVRYNLIIVRILNALKLWHGASEYLKAAVKGYKDMVGLTELPPGKAQPGVLEDLRKELDEVGSAIVAKLDAESSKQPIPEGKGQPD